LAPLNPSNPIKSRLKLKDLRTLSVVVGAGSMAKAATSLGLTQPAVSRALSELEATLGVPLLERTVKGVTPTIYCDALLRGSAIVFDELSQTIEHIKCLSDPMSGRVAIGTTTSLLTGFIPAVIDRFTLERPRVVVDVVIANSPDELYSAVRARSIDLCVSRVPRENVADLRKEILFEDPIVIIAGRSDTRYRRRKLRLGDLADHAWCLPQGEMLTGALMRQVFKAAGLNEPRVAVNCGSMQLQTALVETGRYLSMVPESFVKLRARKEGFQILRVTDFKISPPPIGITTLKARTLSPATTMFIECARQVTKQLGAAPKNFAEQRTAAR